MLNDEDARWLARIEDLRLYLVPAVILGALGVLNLVLAVRFAGMQGLVLPDLLREAAAGFRADQSYAGALVKAIERLSFGVLQWGAAAVLVLAAATQRAQHRRFRRIIETLQRSHK